MKDPEVKIEYEDETVFEFDNFSIVYNQTYGYWKVVYYDNEDEQEEIFTSVEDLPKSLDISEELFNSLRKIVEDASNSSQ